MGDHLNKNKSDEILSRIKQEHLEANSAIEEEMITVVIIKLSGDYYAFLGEVIKEIIQVGKISYVPGCPDFILGIINVRGEVESVLDITRFLDIIPKKNTPLSRITIAEKGGIRSGILVDSVEDVIEISKNSFKPPVSTISANIKSYVAGEISYQNNMTTVIDLGEIFKQIVL